MKLDKSFESKNWLNAGKVPDELRFDPQIKAFMRAIRHGETNQTPQAYYMVNGGDLYMKATGYQEDLIDSVHPGKNFRGKKGTTSAAGAYQFVYETWSEMAKLNDMGVNPQMSPVNQEKLALAAIAYRGALPAVLRGDLDYAISKLGAEWQAFKPDVMKKQGRTIQDFKDVFVSWGGVLAQGN